MLQQERPSVALLESLPSDVKVFYKNDLSVFNTQNASKCEICHNEMTDHQWTVLDEMGFAVIACSFHPLLTENPLDA